MNYDDLPANVYYDANIINNDQSGTKDAPKLVFQDIRSTPILSYPQLYELSVVRFNIQTANSLPLWIPSIKLDQVEFDPNITTYSFTLEYLDFRPQTMTKNELGYPSTTRYSLTNISAFQMLLTIDVTNPSPIELLPVGSIKVGDIFVIDDGFMAGNQYPIGEIQTDTPFLQQYIVDVSTENKPFWSGPFSVIRSANENYSSGQTFVKYIPNDISAAIPSPTTNEEVHIPYYYVKSFNTIVEMLNNGLSEAFQRLKNSASYQGVDLPTQNPPFFEWDIDTSKFILNADVLGFNSFDSQHISISCNTALYTLISGFQADYYGTQALDGVNYVFNLKKDIRELNLFTISDTYSVIQLHQEYSSAALFTPISSIVFTTNLLPVLPSNSSKPTIYNGTGDLVNSGNNNNITNMITDFESQDNNGYGFSGSLSYIPSGEYRCITLNNGNSKINNIDISVYWKDQYSNLHPMYLLPGCKCDIKILFRKIKK